MSPVDGSGIVTVGPGGGLGIIMHGENTGATVVIKAHLIVVHRRVVVPVSSSSSRLKPGVATNMTFGGASGGAIMSSHGTTGTTGACTRAENKANPDKLSNTTAVVTATTTGTVDPMPVP